MGLKHSELRGVIDTALKLSKLASVCLSEHDLAGFLRLSNGAEKALVFLELQTELATTTHKALARMRLELVEMQDELLTLTLEAKLIPAVGDA